MMKTSTKKKAMLLFFPIFFLFLSVYYYDTIVMFLYEYDHHTGRVGVVFPDLRLDCY
jgi:hypothetical protein